MNWTDATPTTGPRDGSGEFDFAVGAARDNPFHIHGPVYDPSVYEDDVYDQTGSWNHESPPQSIRDA